MLIDLNEDTLQDLISKNEKVVVQFSASWKLSNNETKIQKIGFRKRCNYFVLVDAENS
jgi:hypothetical protein